MSILFSSNKLVSNSYGKQDEYLLTRCKDKQNK